jgi:hypothetical protein
MVFEDEDEEEDEPLTAVFTQALKPARQKQLGRCPITGGHPDDERKRGAKERPGHPNVLYHVPSA